VLARQLELILLWGALLACLARLWIAPLPSSLWVDEMVTMFVVHHGSNDPSLAVAPQIRNSAYYVLPKASEALFGTSEVSYRLPSVLAMAVGLWFIARLAARFVHPRAGWFAAFTCLLLPGINYQADDARPYAFGTCVGAAAIWFLVRWLDKGRWRDAAWFVVCAALLWRIHLIFWPLYLVLGLYTVVRRMRGETEVGWRRIAGVFALLGILLIPVLLTAVALLKQAKAHVIAPEPNYRELKRSLQLPLPLFTAGIAFLLSRLFNWKGLRARTPGASTCLIFGWWLIPPLALFAFSRFTGDSVFVARYLYIALPGAALVAVFACARFIPAARWNQLAIVLGLVVLGGMGQWRVPSPQHNKSNWRAAAKTIDELKLDPATPIICPSPFIEAESPVWRPDYRLPGFLYAHLPVYRLTGKPYLLPFQPSLEAEAYAARLSESVLDKWDRFVIYGGDHNVLFWRDWFGAQPALRAWSSRRLGPFGDVETVVFERVRPDNINAGLSSHVTSARPTARTGS
jgi:hypothetical protein